MKKIILLTTTLFLCSCTDSFKAEIDSIGAKHEIILYSGGVAVENWVSTGKVSTMDGSDGWQFMDEKTKKLVRVSGNVVIKVIE